MKKQLLSCLTISMLLLIIGACSQTKQVSGSSNYITKDIRVGSFSKIKSMSSSDIVYTQKQGTPTVQIYGPDNIVQLLETTVEGKTLVVKFKKNSSIRNSGKLEIRVSSPSLNHLSIYGSGNTTFTNGMESNDDLEICIYGSGNINGTNFSCTKLSTHIYGSGNINLKKIDVPCTEANISGSGNVLLNGKSGKAEYRIAGSGDINAIDLKTEDVNAHISGSGSIKCHATENLTGGVSGSGSVAYKCNPQINFSKRGLRKL